MRSDFSLKHPEDTHCSRHSLLFKRLLRALLSIWSFPSRLEIRTYHPVVIANLDFTLWPNNISKQDKYASFDKTSTTTTSFIPSVFKTVQFMLFVASATYFKKSSSPSSLALCKKSTAYYS